jgi:hypothetical protein
MASSSVLRELRAVASAEKAAVLQRFFKTGPGEYGEGDRFLGVMVPQIRAIARAHKSSATDQDIQVLLASPYHEARECGLFLLVGKFRASPKDALRTFLSAHLSVLPRTSLRYAIERFPRDERKDWLSRR